MAEDGKRCALATKPGCTKTFSRSQASEDDKEVDTRVTALCGLLLLFGFVADAGGTRTYRGAPEPIFSVIIMPRSDLYEEAVKCGFNLVRGRLGHVSARRPAVG